MQAVPTPEPTWNGDFFVIPYIRVLYYSLIDNQFRRNFVWFDNYIKTLTNEYFLLSLKNSLLLILFFYLTVDKECS